MNQTRKEQTESGLYKPSWGPVTIVFTYAIVGVLWITATDRLLIAIGLTPEMLTDVQSAKGALFVLVTGTLLFFQIRSATRALKRSEEKYRGFIENSSEGVYLLELEKPVALQQPLEEQIEAIYRHAYIDACNEQFARMCGYERERDLLGTRLKNLALTNNNPFSREQMQQFLTSDYRISDVIARETEGTGEQQFISHREIGAVEDGFLTRIWGARQDVTERKIAEEALRRSQKMEAVGQLTGGVAHDFNNLLGVIVLHLDMLRYRLHDDSQEMEAVETSLKAARHAAQLTKRLLAFSRREPVEAAVTDINDVIAGMQDIISVTLPQAVTHEFRPDTGIWPTRIDPGELEDALLNLVINARDAMPDGGRLVIETGNQTIDEVYARRNPNLTPGDYVTMSVGDTGTGISKKNLERIFDPFFSTKPAEQGSGLGLSMVYGFVTRADGDIKVYSEPGYGTTFRLLLPRAAEDIPETETIPEQLPRGTETILVVDDEAAIREWAASILSRLGYQTLAAKDAAQALIILKEEADVDLLFSDVILPGDMLGFGLARTALRQRSDLKVLLTSGFTGQTEQGTDTEALLQNFLKKPYSTHDLAHHVRAVLDERSSSS